MEKKFYLFLSISLIILSIILASLSIIFAYSIHVQRNEFLEKESIHSEKFSVRMRDGVEIKGLLYIDEDLEEKKDNSVSSVLLLHGINGRKEQKTDTIFELVKRGFAVFSVEQRGHGESGGSITFLDKEPHDMEEVIDYIEDHFEFSNVSHIALLGYSYGGGIGAILQAIDDRVYVSVLYHPLVSLEHLTKIMPFQNLIGVTYSIGHLEDIKDGLDVCTSANTKNLLLIHGEDDELISKEDSEELYEQVGGNYRDDIGLEIRPNLNHLENDLDEDSFKYAIVWLEHFYHDKNIDITNRDLEISKIKLENFDYPDSPLPEYLILISALILFFGISLLILPTRIWPLSSRISSSQSIDYELDPQEYKKILLSRMIIYLIPVIIGAPLFALFNPSYLFGYGLIIPIATIILFLLMPHFEHSDWKKEWKLHLKTDFNLWYKNNLRLLLYGLSIVMIPILYYIIIYNLNANLMTSVPISFFNTAMIIYLSIGISSFYMDYLLIRGLKIKHSVILIPLRSLTLIIFFIFVPIPPFGFTGLPLSGEVAQILIFSLIGLVFWTVIMLMRFMKMIYKNIIPVILIFIYPLIILLLFLYFRII